MDTFRKTTFLAAILSGLVFTSCKEKSESTEKVQSEAEEVLTDAKTEINSDVKLDITDYFSGPNYMKIVMAENNGLNLSEEQKKVFKAWSIENHSKVKDKMKTISLLEQEIKSLSQNKGAADEILGKLSEVAKIRRAIADKKISCRDHIIENVNTEQWNTLVADYQSEYPHIERKDILDILHHVNPVPNYMQAIKADTSELELTADQQKVFDTWGQENQPKMITMTNQITALEKDVYNASIQQKPKSEILDKVNEIEAIRKAIVSKKTSCRDLIAGTLSSEQWAALIAKGE